VRAQSGESATPVVETRVAEDAAHLASGKREGTALEEGALVLAAGIDRGSVETDDFPASEPFDRLCASWNAETKDTSTVEVLSRVVLDDGTRTDWLSLGVSGRPDESARVSRSVRGPTEGPVRVAIDTLEVAAGSQRTPRGRAFALKLVLARASGGASPRVRRLCAVAWPRGRRDPEPADTAAVSSAWGKVLAVPERSQRVEDRAIEGRICSPTSLSMVLAFHGVDRPTSEVAREVLDREAGIYGNWALNVAYAGRLGLDAEIARFGSFRPLESEIAAGRPVVISHRFSPGELEGAPIASSDGHLIVVRGFTASGDVVVNDPAADPRQGARVERTYRRGDLERTWLGNGDGIAYLVRKR
jgi:hypothetical protein